MSAVLEGRLNAKGLRSTSLSDISHYRCSNESYVMSRRGDTVVVVGSPVYKETVACAYYSNQKDTR